MRTPSPPPSSYLNNAPTPGRHILPCEQCGSTDFQIDAGLTFCTNGHEQRRGLAEGEDENDWNKRGGKLHRDTVKDAKKGKAAAGAGRVLRGRKAAEEWAKGMGGVCWGVGWGVGRGLGFLEEGEDGASVDVEGGKTKSAGDEFWSIVRGLWAMRLGELAEQWDAKAGMELEDTDATEAEVSVDTDTEQQDPTENQQKPRYLRSAPKLIDTVAVNYLALLLLRRPLSLNTLLGWLQTETVPYVRAIRHVAPVLRDRLPPEYHLSLDTYTILRPDELQLAMHRNARHYITRFGLALPPLNWPPLLLEWIEALALPMQVYGMVKRLNDICGFSFAYQSSRGGRRSATSYPEAQLMALLVVAVKLLFPFDAASVKRYARSATEQSLVVLDWRKWLEAKEWFDVTVEQGREQALVPGKEMEIKDVDVMGMGGEELDAYMDWYQGMWMSEKVEADAVGVQSEILAMFPTTQLHTDDKVEQTRRREARVKGLREERVKMMLGDLKRRKVVTDEQEQELQAGQDETQRKILRPGMAYQVFLAVGDLQGVAKTFHQEAADTACLDIRGLLRAVNKVETIIDGWRREQKREQVFGESPVLNVDLNEEALQEDVA
ncbi:uncharacterized protein HMPREF1541_00441 [Cyphellophora europaea CBS 101466]|uniref:Uncharacterized protein n=1 Tax=Cyphellophora europaea (strain CBS 101466) TaxID=1220924 RepID=W2SC21_CYPE1|nr:uncharacterized protein HMPREF1541_00441 [Cyphellophora europaea CBS 101466]ETN46257.1 hypothetical protein HMPREF1541_00441 [Cyphellophora europaea CBS 101466]